jgi:valyl-tRNA synthetase
MQLPEKPSLDGLEDKWGGRWDAARTFAFDRTKTREQIFSIDTPPPTVSGSLHMGSVFGYAQTDVLARQRRMLGYELFYPMGWDDNGLATERRVQNFYGVRCDPSLPVEPDFVAAELHRRPLSTDAGLIIRPERRVGVPHPARCSCPSCCVRSPRE